MISISMIGRTSIIISDEFWISEDLNKCEFVTNRKTAIPINKIDHIIIGGRFYNLKGLSNISAGELSRIKCNNQNYYIKTETLEKIIFDIDMENIND